MFMVECVEMTQKGARKDEASSTSLLMAMYARLNEGAWRPPPPPLQRQPAERNNLPSLPTPGGWLSSP